MPAETSALAASKDHKGDLSYYYAQENGVDGKDYFPPDAVVRDCDPLLRADGLGPKSLDSTNAPQEIVFIEGAPARTKWIDKFSFADEGANVKVYVEFPESVKKAKITCEFGPFSVLVLAEMPGGGDAAVYGFRQQDRPGETLGERFGGWSHETVPETCKHRVSSSGERVTLTLSKKKEGKWGTCLNSWCGFRPKTYAD